VKEVLFMQISGVTDNKIDHQAVISSLIRTVLRTPDTVITTTLAVNIHLLFETALCH
jgi:hypothetical protein